MKLDINKVLGIGGLISMVASPILAFSGVKTDVAVNSQRISAVEQSYKTISDKQDKQTIILVKVAAKLGISTDSLSLINLN